MLISLVGAEIGELIGVVEGTSVGSEEGIELGTVEGNESIILEELFEGEIVGELVGVLEVFDTLEGAEIG